MLQNTLLIGIIILRIGYKFGENNAGIIEYFQA